jgi:hypothetical protein
MNELTTTPSNLLAQAIEKGLDIETLEKLMGLQERWNENQARKAFFDAKSKFLAKKPQIKRTSGVSHDGGKTNKYFFAKLPDIQKLVDPILSEFGLSYSFKQDMSDDKIRITCVLTHIDGHSEETYLEAGRDQSGGKNDIQALGSAVSYLQRYTFKNALGLSEGDDDGASTQLSRDEVNQMALDKLKALQNEKGELLDEKTAARLTAIIDGKEEQSYKKAIKILEDL